MLEPNKLLGKVRFDKETGLFRGEILHLHEIEYFQAATIEELRDRFANSLAESATKSAPGDNLILNLDPYLRFQIFELAEMEGISSEAWAIEVLKEGVNKSQFLEPA